MATANGFSLDERIAGTPRRRFLRELFRNSGHFPAANLLLEALTEGAAMFRAADPYVLIAATLAQAYSLSVRAAVPPLHRFLGNLLGPALYTAAELAIEGVRVLGQPHHLAFWAFAALIGIVQALRECRVGPAVRGELIVIENVARAAILFVMYAIFEAMSESAAFSVGGFFSDRAHVFIALATLMLGVSLGLAAQSEEAYLALLRATSEQLRRYSEWLLGRELLERAIGDPEALSLARRERTVLFMDIRGFTAWSEAHTPEAVVAVLNEYYDTAEPLLRAHGAVKHKASADEVLAVFETARDAVACARALRDAIAGVFNPRGLGAGIGIHAGPLVEGLVGGAGAKAYDVIGDTVNTAKRIEGAAARGEVLISASVRDALGADDVPHARREITVKGKEAPLAVYPLP